MVLPLKDLPALEMVSMTTYTAAHNIQRITLNAVIENPSVKVIQIRDGFNWLDWKRNKPRYSREKFVLGEGHKSVQHLFAFGTFVDPFAIVLV